MSCTELRPIFYAVIRGRGQPKAMRTAPNLWRSAGHGRDGSSVL